MTRLLLDTHILLALAREGSVKLEEHFASAIDSDLVGSCASVASLWEIAIKLRLGKLALTRPLDRLLEYFRAIGLSLLIIDQRHAIARVEPEPETKDPFDRLLLAQCQVEGLSLVTRDSKLASHPLAWRPD